MVGVIEPKTARHRIVSIDGAEQLSVPSRRQVFTLIFLPLWLVGWAFGAHQAFREIMVRANLFLIVWLVIWICGGALAFATWLMQVGGTERVSVRQGDLEISNGIGPLRRTWRYRGSAILDLVSSQPNDGVFGQRGLDRPFFMRPRTGAVSFSYGAETIYFAAGVDEPEGRVIVEWLRRRLPMRAMPAG